MWACCDSKWETVCSRGDVCRLSPRAIHLNDTDLASTYARPQGLIPVHDISVEIPSHSGVPRPCCAVTGWHGVELRYSKSPLDQTSVFKFFVIDAEQVETVYNSGVPSNQILWKVSPVVRWLSQPLVATLTDARSALSSTLSVADVTFTDSPLAAV